MIETINFAKQLNPDFAIFSIATLFPGTELYNLSLSEGFSKPLIYGSQYSPCVYESSNFNRQELEHMRKKALREFYLRPKFFLQRVLRIRTWTEFKTSLKAGYSIFST
ncbi:Uncharacterised protein [uncultured archaeon]|nr:Uncharacterised protein [uncultured archaeon]